MSSRTAEPPNDDSRPLVSVVTVVLNGAAHIGATIGSVRRQSYRPIEHVVVDGGSTDGTVEILRRHQEDLASWVSEPDRGIYDAMNKGIGRSRGQILNMLNSGDRYAADDVVERYVGAFRLEPELNFVYANARMVNEDGTQSVIHGKPIVIDASRIGRRMSICHQAAFYRRTLHDALGPYDLRFPIGADYDLWMRANRQGVLRRRFLHEITIEFLAGGPSMGIGNCRDHKIIEDEVLGPGMGNRFLYWKRLLLHQLGTAPRGRRVLDAYYRLKHAVTLRDSGRSRGERFDPRGSGHVFRAGR